MRFARFWSVVSVVVTFLLSPFWMRPVKGDNSIVVREGLKIEVLGKEFTPGPRIVVSQRLWDRNGNTSVRFTSRDSLVWKEQGYFQRNRDLGQVFIAPRDFVLAAIVLRTGPADGAVLHNAPGAEVFVQFFEVEGEPRIDDNGTGPGTAASHGFSKNHRCDDFLVGVTYKPLGVIRGGRFPDLAPSRDEKGQPTGDRSGNLVYLRWRLAEAVRPHFQAQKRYAFLVGFVEPAKERGFTLANRNAAHVPDAPLLGDRHDAYPQGWAIRREGNGVFPPHVIPGASPPGERKLLDILLEEASFPTGMARYLMPPGTNGYPDVDTYRDLQFYLEE